MNTISQNIEQYKLFNAYTSNAYQAENNLLGEGKVFGKNVETNKNQIYKIIENPTQLGKSEQIDKFTPTAEFLEKKEEKKEEEKEPKFGEIGNKTNKSDKNENTKFEKTENKNEAKQNGELTEEEQKVVQKLKERDREVKSHEQAHLAAAGGLAKGGPSYTYQVGPDGGQYAIGGEVQIELSGGSTPQETISKMQQVRRAALAPAEPSGQDISVANSASKIEAEARAQLQAEQTEAAKPKERPKEIQKEKPKTENKIDFSKLLNNKYGVSNKSEDKENNIINSKNNEFSILNNKSTNSESLGKLVDFKVQSQMVAGLSCCSGMSGCMMCAPKLIQ